MICLLEFFILRMLQEILLIKRRSFFEKKKQIDERKPKGGCRQGSFVIAGVGVIILGKNIMEAATAFQQQDSAGLNNAIKGIIAGGLMAAVGSIVTAMGFV